MNEFGRLLEKEIPRLRRYAFALTRNMSRADDLVQDTLVRAIAKQHRWQWGSNHRAWLFTIMHHLNVSRVRRSMREAFAVEVDDTWPFLITQPIRQRGCHCAISIALSPKFPRSGAR